jgi:Tfp pilus assembly ATPase PilU
MYAMDDPLGRVRSERADELQLHVGLPPVLVVEGQPFPVAGPAITGEDAEELLQNIANSRQRRVLRMNGRVQFIYRFQGGHRFCGCGPN